MVIKWATSALATLRTGQTSQGEPLTRAERLYLSRGLARAFAALMDLEQTAERAEDGALVYHEDGQALPWTKERPHSVADLPPFAPGPQAVWRSLAGQDPEADQVAPTARSASRGEKDPPSGSPEGRRQTAPKLAHTISFKPPEEIDATTDEGKLGILALVVKAMYPSIDNLLLQWVVLKLGPTLPNGDPRFDSAKLREFNEKKEENKKKKENKKEGNKPEEDEKISITTDEKFTSELDLVLLQAPNRYGLIGAEVYRGSSGMYYIVGAEFGAFLVAITGGAGLGLLASGGGTVVAEGTAIALETAAPSFGEIVGEASLRLGVSAQAAWAQAAPWVTAITASTTAGYGIQAAFEGRFGEWLFETMNDLAEQHFLFHASGLHYTPSEPEVQGAPPEPTAPAAAGIAAEDIQVPRAAAETPHEPPALPPGATATTEQVTSTPPAAAAAAKGDEAITGGVPAIPGRDFYTPTMDYPLAYEQTGVSPMFRGDAMLIGGFEPRSRLVANMSGGIEAPGGDTAPITTVGAEETLAPGTPPAPEAGTPKPDAVPPQPEAAPTAQAPVVSPAAKPAAAIAKTGDPAVDFQARCPKVDPSPSSMAALRELFRRTLSGGRTQTPRPGQYVGVSTRGAAAELEVIVNLADRPDVVKIELIPSSSAGRSCDIVIDWRQPDGSIAKSRAEITAATGAARGYQPAGGGIATETGVEQIIAAVRRKAASMPGKPSQLVAPMPGVATGGMLAIELPRSSSARGPADVAAAMAALAPELINQPHVHVIEFYVPGPKGTGPLRYTRNLDGTFTLQPSVTP